MNAFPIYVKIGHCSACHNSLVIQRKYSGETLCPECFAKSIEKKISQTISKYKIFNRYDKIVVALSGGKDSTTLLYNLIKIHEKNHYLEPIVALTIDEGIKDYRSNAVESAKKFCKAYNLEHKIISFKNSIGKTLDDIILFKKQSDNYKYACNYCATIRRRLLNDGAKELGATSLAMGHNLTDIVETYLMNIFYKRFQNISNQFFFKSRSEEINKYFVKKIMPLMKIPEEEIFLYANIKHLDYYPSHCPYREIDPIARKRVLDFIQKCKEFSPEIEFNLFNGFLELSEILYNYYNKNSYFLCQKCGYPCGNTEKCTYCRLMEDLIE